MKIAVVNYSGNVGKTTLARDMLKINLPDYDLLSIESVNADGKEETVIRGEDGDQLYIELLLRDNLILDIGSSNLESYFRNSEKERELILSVDLFILPTTPEKKQQADTAKTIEDLLNLGVIAEKIHVILNQIDERNGLPEEIFRDLIQGLRKVGIVVNPDNYIYRHDLYDRGQRLSNLLTEKDYRALMEEAKKNGEDIKARDYATKYIRAKKADALNTRYREIFNRIFGEIL